MKQSSAICVLFGLIIMGFSPLKAQDTSAEAIEATEAAGSALQEKLDADGKLKTDSVTAEAGAEEQKDSESSRKKDVEKIEVTGSFIKRVDTAGPSPVITIDREDLEKSGYNSVSDVLRDNAFVVNGAREGSGLGGAGAGAATAGIRGVGAGRVLVLLNNQRLPKIGGGNEVDLNMIPMSAIERIDILKDGASALYGSDALGGVINFITKKDYDGVSISGRYSQPELVGGNRSDLSATYGKNFDKGNFLVIYQYRSNKRVYDKDREFSRMTDVATQGSANSTPPTWTDLASGTVYAGSAANPCPAERTQNIPGVGNICRFDYTQFSSGLPDLEQHSLVVSTQYDVSESTNIFFNGSMNKRLVNWNYAPAAGRFDVTEAVAENQFGLPAADVGAEGARINYRTIGEFGNRATRATTHAYGAQAGMKNYLSDTWELETSASYGVSNTYDLGHAGYGNFAIFNTLAAAGAFNPFKSLGTKDQIPSAEHVSESWVDTNQAAIRTVARGELYEGGSSFGPVFMGIGASTNWQTYDERVDSVTKAGNLFGGSGSDGQGLRDFQAIFAEFVTMPIESIEIQLAARYDHYSDFGSSVNPKLGLAYKANQKTLIRGSAGTGFRAPDLGDLNRGQSQSFPSFIDMVACAGGNTVACSPDQYEVEYSGNKELEPETSFTYNLGILHQPNKKWDFSVDYWAIKLKNLIALDEQSVTEAELRGVPLPAGVSVLRDANNQIVLMKAPSINVGEREEQGVDFVIGHNSKVSMFGLPLDMRVQFEHLQTLYSKSEDIPGLPVRRNRNLFWKNTMTVAFAKKPHTIRFTARSVAGGDKATNEAEIGVVGYGSTSDYTGYDLNYTHGNVFGGSFSFGIKNLFGTDRPLDDQDSITLQLNQQLYDSIGRLFYAGYEYTF